MSASSRPGEKIINDGIEQINQRVTKVFNAYLKDKQEDGKEFVTGYVEGTEVLDTFFEDYKRAGGVGFSIRDSWRRSGLTSQPRLREFEPGRGLDDVNDKPSPSNDTSKAQSQPEVRGKTHSGQKGTGALETQCRILWQSQNGCLKLPNLGMPFIIQAYERRVCTFTTTRRSKKERNETGTDLAESETTQDPPSELNKQGTTAIGLRGSTSSRKRNTNVGRDESSKKKRIRKSMKKDCKAVVELKEIWIFADYKPIYAEDSTEHAKRKAREKIISRLQTEIKSGKVKYLKRYYLRLPYPSVHSGHEIGLNNKMCKVSPFVVTCIQNLVTEGITAIKNVQHHINKQVDLECAKSSNRYIFGLNYDNSYYPDEKTIRNHIYLALNAIKAKAPVKKEPERGRPPSPRHVRLLSNTASNVRSELKEINNLTQKCQDVQLLTELLQQIETIRKDFQDKLDKTLLLPREPIPIISTQDSHEIVSSLEGLNQDVFSCKNPVEDAASLGIDTDLAAAEILQSFTSNSFTHRDGLTDSPANFDNIPPIPEMFQQLVNMMPETSQHEQHIQQNLQNQPQQHDLLSNQNQQQQHTQYQQQLPQGQQQLTQNQQPPQHSTDETHYLMTTSYVQLPTNSVQLPQPQVVHCIDSGAKNDTASVSKGRTIQLPQCSGVTIRIGGRGRGVTPGSTINTIASGLTVGGRGTNGDTQLTQTPQLVQQQPRHSQDGTQYQLMTSYVQLPTTNMQLPTTSVQLAPPPQLLRCVDSDSIASVPEESGATVHTCGHGRDISSGSAVNTIESSLTLGGSGSNRDTPT